MNPKIGIVAAAHRTQNWMDLYKSIGTISNLGVRSCVVEEVVRNDERP